MLHFLDQLSDRLGKPANRVIDAELVRAVRVDLAAASAVEQKFTRLARLTDPREVSEDVESRLVPNHLNRLVRQGAEHEL